MRRASTFGSIEVARFSVGIAVLAASCFVVGLMIPQNVASAQKGPPTKGCPPDPNCVTGQCILAGGGAPVVGAPCGCYVLSTGPTFHCTVGITHTFCITGAAHICAEFRACMWSWEIIGGWVCSPKPGVWCLPGGAGNPANLWAGHTVNCG